jgi:hypothetical protein
LSFGFDFSVKTQIAIFSLSFLLLISDMAKSLKNLFAAKSDGYTLLFFSCAAVFAQGIYLLLSGEPEDGFVFYGCVASIVIVVTLVGKQLSLSALLKNAAVLQNAKELWSVKAIFREGNLDSSFRLESDGTKIFALRAKAKESARFMRLAGGENDANFFLFLRGARSHFLRDGRFAPPYFACSRQGFSHPGDRRHGRHRNPDGVRAFLRASFLHRGFPGREAIGGLARQRGASGFRGFKRRDFERRRPFFERQRRLKVNQGLRQRLA